MLKIDVHRMMATTVEHPPVGRMLTRHHIDDNTVAWADEREAATDRQVRLRQHTFAHTVYLTNVFGTAPDYTLLPPLRFYSISETHLCTVHMSADGTPWIACACDDRCGVCADTEAAAPTT